MISRDDWGAKPPESPLHRWNVSALDGIVVHWFGSPKAADSHAGCDDLLRTVQRIHQNGEYIDIAYNIGVCPHGERYHLRGWQFQTGANGTSDANSRFASVVYMAGEGDPLTAEGERELRATLKEGFRLGIAQRVKKHKDFVSTGCPGPRLSRWVDDGEWKEPTKVEQWIIDFATGEKNKDGTWVRAERRTNNVAAWMRDHPAPLQRAVIHVRPVRD